MMSVKTVNSLQIPLVNKRGQSTVEFVLTLVLITTIMFFFIKISLFFAYANYVQYATYMSSRAYLSSGLNKQDQRQRARTVIQPMVTSGQGRTGEPRWPGIAVPVGQGAQGLKGVGIGAGEQLQEEFSDPSLNWQVGVRYDFKGDFFLDPFKSEGQQETTTNLTSESWLGREPTRSECRQFLENLQGRGRIEGKKLLFDNGC